MTKPKVSTLILAIALGVASLAAFSFYAAKNTERTKRIAVEQELMQTKEAIQRLSKEKEELSKAKEALDEQVTTLKQQAEMVSGQLAQEKRAREALTAELAQARKEGSQWKVQLDSEQKEKVALTEDLAKAKQSYQALSNELTTLRQAKEALEKRVKEMLAERAKQAEQIVVTPSAGAAGTVPAPSLTPPTGSVGVVSAVPAGKAPLEGKILVVNREFNFVVMNLGSKDGVRAGNRYSVFKGTKRIGAVEVERIYDNLSAANVLEEEKKGEIREGDVVQPVS